MMYWLIPTSSAYQPFRDYECIFQLGTHKIYCIGSAGASAIR